jgi:hypothetical protein
LKYLPEGGGAAVLVSIFDQSSSLFLEENVSKVGGFFQFFDKLSFTSLGQLFLSIPFVKIASNLFLLKL